MAVYVDELRTIRPADSKPQAQRNGDRWCHMTADSERELHDFAARLGLRREWYQVGGRKVWHWYLSHYDLVPSKRALAVRLGAQEVILREMAERFAAELRAQPAGSARMGEHDEALRRQSLIDADDKAYSVRDGE